MKNFIIFWLIMSLIFYGLGYFMYEIIFNFVNGPLLSVVTGSIIYSDFPFLLPVFQILIAIFGIITTLIYPLHFFGRFSGEYTVLFLLTGIYYLIIAIPLYFIYRTISKTWNKYIEAKKVDY